MGTWKNSAARRVMRSKRSSGAVSRSFRERKSSRRSDSWTGSSTGATDRSQLALMAPTLPHLPRETRASLSGMASIPLDQLPERIKRGAGEQKITEGHAGIIERKGPRPDRSQNIARVGADVLGQPASQVAPFAPPALEG